MIGGQAGISGHLKIGNNVQIGGGSGVIKDIPDNSKVMGYPAKNLKNFISNSNDLNPIFSLNFEECLNNTKIEDFILEDRINGAKKFKIEATPTLIIDGEKFENPLNYKKLKKYLDPKSITWLEVYEHWSGLIKEKDIPKGAILSKTSSYEQKKKSPCFEMYRRAHILSNGSVGVCSCRDIEGEIVTIIQEAKKKYDGLIINAAGYTHTSVAIHDALVIFKKPSIELHISNIYKREEFRHKSMISDVVTVIICGLGANGYILAINAMHELLKNGNR